MGNVMQDRRRVKQEYWKFNGKELIFATNSLVLSLYLCNLMVQTFDIPKLRLFDLTEIYRSTTLHRCRAQKIRVWSKHSIPIRDGYWEHKKVGENGVGGSPVCDQDRYTCDIGGDLTSILKVLEGGGGQQGYINIWRGDFHSPVNISKENRRGQFSQYPSPSSQVRMMS